MEIFSNFHPIYLIFPLCLSFLLLFKESKLKTLLITISFILIFVLAETGADYDGYKEIYEKCLNKEVHGEWLFVVLCKFFNIIDVSYNCFRVVFLTTFTILFAYSLSKLSKNFTLSFLLSYLIYVIYFISALRQFATMAILFYTLHLYLNKNKIAIPITLNVVAIFIHKMAVVQLTVLLLMILYEKLIKKKNFIEKQLLKKWFLIIISSCLVVRVGIFILLRTSIGTNIMGMLPYPELSVVNLGLIARIAILICLTNLYVYSKDSANSNMLFSIYFIAMLLYLVFPSELIMGRLMNNIKMLEVILIPSMLLSFKIKEINEGKNLFILKICLIVLIIVIVLIFFSQLINQVGYDYYMHMLWR